MADQPENGFAASGKRLKRAAAGYVKGALRRTRDEFLPNREVREHESWIAQRLMLRREIYTHSPEPGLLSVMTAVWDGSPEKYLRVLAESLTGQIASAETEWVLLDNGCQRKDLLAYLEELSALPFVTLIRSPENAGITQGLRLCLERARGRYVLPVDGDDLLDHDALRVVTSAIVQNNYAPLLYTDEDKIIGSRRYQPYLKPDWDPVLLLNSAYIAHLGIIDRQLALDLGAYNDRGVEASPDWDLFVRALSAGYSAFHIPEVVYSWRVHAQSTADDAASKPAVHASQTRVLQRYLETRPDGDQFTVERNPLFGGAPHFYLRSKESPAIPVLRWNELNWREKLSEIGGAEFVLLQHEQVEIIALDWEREVTGLLQLHPDTVTIGGRILEAARQRVLEGALSSDFKSPDTGRLATDPGYFGQIWKRRSVPAVSGRLSAVRTGFLSRLLTSFPQKSSFELFWLRVGEHASSERKRIIYTPFLVGASTRS